MRRRLHIAVSAVALAWSLAACGGQDAPGGGQAQDAPAPQQAPAPAAAQPSALADRLAFVDQAGAPRLLLDCLAAPSPVLRATVSGFRKIDSEDRLTVGAGDEAFALAADLSSPEAGIVASGVIDADLLRRISDGEPVSAVYGAQSVGPLHPAPGVLPDGFVVRCRELAAG